MLQLVEDLDKFSVQFANSRSLMLSGVPSFKEYLSTLSIFRGAGMKTSSCLFARALGSKDA
jgi:hypothetical protein